MKDTNMKKRHVTMVLVGAVLILTMALGVATVFAQTDQDPDTPPETSEEPFHRWGKRGFGFGGQMEGLNSHDELIAGELGVAVEDLRGAFSAAFEAAREDGVLGIPGHGGIKADGEFESYLSDALAEIGVTIEELKAAQEAVKDAMIAELVEQGIVTEEQLNLMEAQQALKDYIDYGALMAQAADSLGIELPDAEEALEGKMDPRALMEQLEEKGITIQDLVAAVQDAYENAVNDAVSEGVIDGDQAALILEKGFGFAGMRGFGGMQGFGGMRGFGDMHGFECENGMGGMRGFDAEHSFGSGQGFHHGGGFRGFSPHREFGAPSGNQAPTGVSL